MADDVEAVAMAVEAPPPGPPLAPVADDPPSHAAADPGADASWHAAVDAAPRHACGGGLPADAARYAARWREEGRDFARDVLPILQTHEVTRVPAAEQVSA